jgi:phytanoyl-CoA hydroxylase
LIDSLLGLYRREILPSGKRFFRQSTNSWEANQLTPAGNVIESFLDIHDMRDGQFAEVCRQARQILCHSGIREALATITGAPKHSLMQSMLFDQNTATSPHEDWYYLDSVPNGYLLAGWFTRRH